MAQSDVIKIVQGLCKLYKGEDTNPYNPDNVPQSEWANEYLKFQIWDAEYSVVKGFEWWYDMWKHQRPANASRGNRKTQKGE